MIEWLDANRRQYGLTGTLIVYGGMINTTCCGAPLTGIPFAIEFRRSGPVRNDNEVRR